jgi:hypothetical protein
MSLVGDSAVTDDDLPLEVEAAVAEANAGFS